MGDPNPDVADGGADVMAQERGHQAGGLSGRGEGLDGKSEQNDVSRLEKTHASDLARARATHKHSEHMVSFFSFDGVCVGIACAALRCMNSIPLYCCDMAHRVIIRPLLYMLMDGHLPFEKQLVALKARQVEDKVVCTVPRHYDTQFKCFCRK
jgi:hypothetical protein